LHSGKYCILNTHYSKEEYEQRTKAILGNREMLADFEKEFKKLTLELPKKNLNNL
jgi:hypothetical protein